MIDNEMDHLDEFETLKNVSESLDTIKVQVATHLFSD